MKKFATLAAILFLTCSQAMAASCWVSEFSALITDVSGRPIPIGQVNLASPTTQAVTATAPAAVTNAFSSGTRYLWVYCDEYVFYQFGTTPTTGMATAQGNGTLMPIPAGGFWLDVPEGLAGGALNAGTLKIALCDADCS